MYLHREGFKIIIVSILLFGGLACLAGYLTNFTGIVFYLVLAFCVVMLYLVIQFFRVPKRKFSKNDSIVISPADGKLVVIERIIENEYFKDERIQLSVFMSPLNVHVNWYPVSGKVAYVKYHPGKYLVAWDPKSSTENERTTVVIDSGHEKVMVRQIAGAVARRIVCYSKEGDVVEQGGELGFIKFGSRVDIILPVNFNITALLDTPVQGLLSQLAQKK
ncbi:MAG TPA: phosphatidylserine decarboxylase family protein [Flavobacteriales bacterium]|nr:phosphatidylserine decarboxylase family protein [Flavobacteriales bacterium]